MRFWHKFQHHTSTLGHYLAKPHILFYALPWLMALITLGTIAQKEMGLHAATEKYFNSIILWLGPIPTPGGLSTIAVIFLALSIKFIFFSEWRWERSGTILTHLGVLTLLVGGILTASTMREGFIMIPESESANKISDYKKRVINFSLNGDIIKTLPFKNIHVGQTIESEGYKFTPLMRCNNCDARAPSGDYKNLKGLAENMEIFATPEEQNIEANFSGLTFEVISPKALENGTYIIMEDIPKTPELQSTNGILRLTLTRETTPLPFAIQLTDFRKIDYPGTNKPREFESDFIIREGDLEWPATVSMNKPLRYKGYSFYQSSFEQRENLEVTVLNVVQNSGKYFPYISTLIIFAGLLLHFIIRIGKMRHVRAREKKVS